MQLTFKVQVLWNISQQMKKAREAGDLEEIWWLEAIIAATEL